MRPPRQLCDCMIEQLLNDLLRQEEAAILRIPNCRSAALPDIPAAHAELDEISAEVDFRASRGETP